MRYVFGKLGNNRSKIGARGFFGCDCRKDAASLRDPEQKKKPLAPISLPLLSLPPKIKLLSKVS